MKKVKCINKNLDYLTISIEAPPVGTMIKMESHIKDERFKRFEKIFGQDEVFLNLKKYFQMEEKHAKKFRDPTNKFQQCAFFDNEKGVWIKRFLNKIPIELKGTAFLDNNFFYKFKTELSNISKDNKIKVSRIDIVKDFIVPNGIEDITGGMDYKKITIDIKSKKNKRKAIHYYDIKSGDLETVYIGWTNFSIKIYRKDIEKDQIKNEIKKKRINQLYSKNKVVRVELSYMNSSKKCESIFNELVFSREKVETIVDRLFSEATGSYPIINKKTGKIIKSIQKIWNL